MHTILRVEHPEHQNGMWYDEGGVFMPVIKDLLPNSVAASLPMLCDEARDPRYKSAAPDMEKMLFWFRKEEIEAMLTQGLAMFRLTVTSVITLEHEVLFNPSDIVLRERIDVI